MSRKTNKFEKFCSISKFRRRGNQYTIWLDVFRNGYFTRFDKGPVTKCLKATSRVDLGDSNEINRMHGIYSEKFLQFAIYTYISIKEENIFHQQTDRQFDSTWFNHWHYIHIGLIIDFYSVFMAINHSVWIPTIQWFELNNPNNSLHGTEGKILDFVRIWEMKIMIEWQNDNDDGSLKRKSISNRLLLAFNNFLSLSHRISIHSMYTNTNSVWPKSFHSANIHSNIFDAQWDVSNAVNRLESMVFWWFPCVCISQSSVVRVVHALLNLCYWLSIDVAHDSYESYFQCDEFSHNFHEYT